LLLDPCYENNITIIMLVINYLQAASNVQALGSQIQH
jgi:hypothetical protein